MYLSGIKSITRLSGLDNETKKQIKAHEKQITEVINDFNGLGSLVRSKIILDVKDNDKLYNQEISKAEKQAWVWWKRSIGIPMTGWEEYFLSGNSGKKTQMVVTTSKVVIKDNHFRDLNEMPAGVTLGKYLKTHKYSKADHYYIVRTDEGLIYVNSKGTKIIDSSVKTDQKELERLINVGALYFLEGELLPYPVYAWGNMYDRQLSLAKDKQHIYTNYGNDIYQSHYNICHKEYNLQTNPQGALPQVKSITNPDENFRPVIAAISSFAMEVTEFSITEVREEYLNIDSAVELKKVNGKIKAKTAKEILDISFDGETKYDLQTVYIKWLYALNSETEFKNSSAIDIVDYYLYNRPLRNDELTRQEKAELKAHARNEGEEMFQRFLYEVLTSEDQKKLDMTWNRLYNGQSKVKYNRIPIAFVSSAKFKTGELRLKPVQREVIGFIELTGSGVLALDVGGGKTMAMIILMAMGIMQGKFKRPLLVLPKPVYGQFIKEIIGFKDRKTGEVVPGVLSNTGITVNEWGNLGTQVQRKFKKNELNKAVPEGSITVITKEGLSNLGFTDKLIDGYLADLLEIFDAYNDDDTERKKSKKEQSIRSLIGSGIKDSIADFDTLGFDSIFADESHAYKNIFEGIPPDKYDQVKRYDLTGASSGVGKKMFFFTNYIQRKYGKNVVLATATPFTKAILEVYSMLSLVALENLKRNNILNLKRFCDQFIKRDVEWVANHKEELVEKEVIKSFVNADILRTLIGNSIFYRSKDSFKNIKLPCKINIPMINEKQGNKVIRLEPKNQVLSYLNMNDEQRKVQQGVVARMKMAGSGQMKAGSAKAMIFQALNDSLSNAFSPFLIDGRFEDYKEFVEKSPKIHAACLVIKSVKQDAKKFLPGESMPGQIIYANRGKQYFPLIKEYLDKEIGFKTGIKFNKSRVDEVEIINSGTSANRKLMIQDAFNSGVCLVIIGTATIQEGLNLQEHATDIHVIQSEWNPTAMVQLAGRVHRQNNPFAYVRFIVYLLQDSVDVPIFQKNEEKIARINDLLISNGQKVIDADTLDAEEIKYSLITEIEPLVRMLFEQEKKELQREYQRTFKKHEVLVKVGSEIDDYKRNKENYIYKLGEHLRDVKSRYSDLKAYKPYKGQTTYDKKNNKKAKDQLLKIIDWQKLDLNTLPDKEILQVWRGLKRIADDIGSNIYQYYYNEFIQSVSSIRKIEKTILNPAGYKLHDDISPLVEQLNLELDAMKEKSKLYMPDNKEAKRWQSLIEYVKQKKSSLAVDGRTPEQIAKQIAKLNKLMAIKLNDKPGTCSISHLISSDAKIKIKALPVHTTKVDVFELEAEANLNLLALLELELLM